MRSRPSDEFEDGDFDDYDEFEDFDVESALLTSELTDELVRHLAENWRVEEENKAISVDVSLSAALNRTPTKWLDAACRANRVATRGIRRDRRARIAALVTALTTPDDLAQSVIDLPAHARAALRRVIDSGGWTRLSELTRDFGGMDGDGWFWDEDPPTSNLGELRRRGLLFIGRAALTKAGKPGKRQLKVAVVPHDLRELLTSILSDAIIRKEEESAIAVRYATSADLLKEAIDAAGGHYDNLDWIPPIARGDVESFLRAMSEEGFNPLLIWFGVDIVLNFVERNLHEIQSPEQLCGYHVSELATAFVDRNYLQRWTLRERRNVIEIVRHLYRHLHRLGRIDDGALDEIEGACTRLNSGSRKLNLIHRPPPLGGELIFTRLNPNTGEEERYTYNHQRLLMAWAGAFHQDWKTMLSMCETVPGGKQKAALIHELIALDPGVCDLIVSQADEEDFDRAILWFYEERVLELSAW
jgi:hypothetical protein